MELQDLQEWPGLESVPLGVLQTALDAATLAVNAVLGPPPTMVEVTEYHASTGLSLIHLERPVDLAQTIVVTTFPDLSYETALAADDFRVNAGSWLERLDTGTSPRTYFEDGQVRVVYTPLDDTADRDRAIAALCMIDANRTDPTFIAENIDGYGYQKSANADWNYEVARKAILDSLVALPGWSFS